MLYKGGVAESGGNGPFIYFYARLLTTKMVKGHFFQIPSFKFKNIASGVYSHPNSAPHALLMLTNLKVYIYSFLNSVYQGFLYMIICLEEDSATILFCSSFMKYFFIWCSFEPPKSSSIFNFCVWNRMKLG